MTRKLWARKCATVVLTLAMVLSSMAMPTVVKADETQFAAHTKDDFDANNGGACKHDGSGKCNDGDCAYTLEGFQTDCAVANASHGAILKTATCATCGAIGTHDPAAAEHKFADFEKQGDSYKCKVTDCTATIDAAGYQALCPDIANHAAMMIDQTCEKCGYQGSEKYDAANCPDAASHGAIAVGETCPKCNYVGEDDGTGDEGDDDSAQHEHAWDTEWTSDATAHWHECTASGCAITADSDKDGYAAHTFGDWEVVTDATYQAAGSKKRTCTVCDFEETEEIPMLVHQHVWNDGVCSGDGPCPGCPDEGTHAGLYEDEKCATCQKAGTKKRPVDAAITVTPSDGTATGSTAAAVKATVDGAALSSAVATNTTGAPLNVSVDMGTVGSDKTAELTLDSTAITAMSNKATNDTVDVTLTVAADVATVVIPLEAITDAQGGNTGKSVVVAVKNVAEADLGAKTTVVSGATIVQGDDGRTVDTAAATTVDVTLFVDGTKATVSGLTDEIELTMPAPSGAEVVDIYYVDTNAGGQLKFVAQVTVADGNAKFSVNHLTTFVANPRDHEHDWSAQDGTCAGTIGTCPGCPEAANHANILTSAKCPVCGAAGTKQPASSGGSTGSGSSGGGSGSSGGSSGGSAGGGTTTPGTGDNKPGTGDNKPDKPDKPDDGNKDDTTTTSTTKTLKAMKSKTSSLVKSQVKAKMTTAKLKKMMKANPKLSKAKIKAKLKKQIKASVEKSVKKTLKAKYGKKLGTAKFNKYFNKYFKTYFEKYFNTYFSKAYKAVKAKK